MSVIIPAVMRDGRYIVLTQPVVCVEDPPRPKSYVTQTYRYFIAAEAPEGPRLPGPFLVQMRLQPNINRAGALLFKSIICNWPISREPLQIQREFADECHHWAVSYAALTPAPPPIQRPSISAIIGTGQVPTSADAPPIRGRYIPVEQLLEEGERHG